MGPILELGRQGNGRRGGHSLEHHRRVATGPSPSRRRHRLGPRRDGKYCCLVRVAWRGVGYEWIIALVRRRQQIWGRGDRLYRDSPSLAGVCVGDVASGAARGGASIIDFLRFDRRDFLT